VEIQTTGPLSRLHTAARPWLQVPDEASAGVSSTKSTSARHLAHSCCETRCAAGSRRPVRRAAASAAL